MTTPTTNTSMEELRIEFFEERCTPVNILSTGQKLYCPKDYADADWLIDKIQLAVERGYKDGFLDGFDFSAEGCNGEYTHPDFNKEKELQEMIKFNLSLLTPPKK